MTPTSATFKTTRDPLSNEEIRAMISGRKITPEDDVRRAIYGDRDRVPQMKASGDNKATGIFEWLSGKYKTSPESYGNIVDRQLEKTSKVAEFVAGGVGEMGRKVTTGEHITGSDALMASLEVPFSGAGLGFIAGKRGARRLFGDNNVIKNRGYVDPVDNELKMEVPDLHYKVKDKEAKQLGDLISHPYLFKAYPDMSDMKIKRVKGEGTDSWIASMNPKDNSITLNTDWTNQLSDDALSSVLLHEAQHGVQRREGFSMGASNKVYNKLKKQFEDNPDYWNTKGEVEARNAQKRFVDIWNKYNDDLRKVTNKEDKDALMKRVWKEAEGDKTLSTESVKAKDQIIGETSKRKQVKQQGGN